ncbi:MAG: PAS domain S-box protein [Planctomycetes bacterium]|nr:PAS domain S-box protein [Planctomycetota bacterium]
MLQELLRPWFLPLAALVAGLGLFLDCAFASASAVPILYLLVLGIVFVAQRPGWLWSTGAVCMVLTLLGAVFSPGPAKLESVLINRGLILAALAGAIVLLRRLQVLNRDFRERTEALARNVETLRSHQDDLSRRGRAMLSVMEDLRIEQDRLTAEVQERRIAEDRFKLTIESSPSGMILIDSNGKIVLANQEAGRLFGYKVQELLNQPIEILVPDRFAVGHPALRDSFIKNPAARPMGAGRDLFGLRKDGSEFPIEIGLNPMRVGEEIFVLSAVVDITERKAAEQALFDANDQLERRVAGRTAALVELNKELEGFSYSVSHDLRAPLRHILGFMELLQEESGHLLDEKGQTYTNLVLDSAKKMDALLEALLAFSRMGRSGMKKAQIPVAPLVSDVVALLDRNTNGKKPVEWRIGPLPEVYADPTLLRQLFFNLLANAMKFSAHNGQAVISVGTMESLNEDILFVRDNGIGLDMKYVDKIFDPFQRLHTDEEYEGSGIGLAFVKRIVVRHGGRVWVESQPGKGATFFVALPRKVQTEQ